MLVVFEILEIMRPFVIRVPGLKPFSYRVPNGSARVLMTVENMDGRRVWSRELKADREGRVFWNGRGENGHPVPPAMYVVRMKPGQ